MKHSLILTSSLISLLTIATPAAAQWSVGATVGQSSIDDSDDVCVVNCTVDDRDTTAGVNLGYSINDIWGVELGYLDFGTTSINSTIAGRTFSAGVDSSALYLVGTGQMELGEKWSLTGRLGVASLDINTRASFLSLSESSEEAMVGASLDYSFSKSLVASLRIDKVSDANSIGLSLQYVFGN